MTQQRPNPALLQQGDQTRTPLFLIHDAGGGVSDYLKLDDLGRPVYSIHNPWFDSETKWQGGTRRFVEEYIRLIKTVVPRGEVLVGGWSLGGQLAIDIARLLSLERRPKLRVVGILMIDTLFPYWGPPDTTIHAPFPADRLLGRVPADIRPQVIKCMQWTMEDSLEWAALNSDSLPDAPPEDKLVRGEVEAAEPPCPAVLLFAREYIPVDEDSKQKGLKAMTDYLRHDKGGWNLFSHGMDWIVAVWEVGGHHFGLFERDTIKETSEKVRKACDLLAED